MIMISASHQQTCCGLTKWIICSVTTGCQINFTFSIVSVLSSPTYQICRIYVLYSLESKIFTTRWIILSLRSITFHLTTKTFRGVCKKSVSNWSSRQKIIMTLRPLKSGLEASNTLRNIQISFGFWIKGQNQALSRLLLMTASSNR